MYNDFKDISMNLKSTYFIGSIEFEAIAQCLKQYIINDDLKSINKLFNKYDADRVLFKNIISHKEDTKRLIPLFNLASNETQKHLFYHLVNTKKFNDHTEEVFKALSDIVYMKDNPSLFTYFLQIMEDKEYLFKTYSEEGKFSFSGTILNNIFHYNSKEIFSFVMQSNEFIQSLNNNKDWKFVKMLTNKMTEQIPNDRMKMLDELINQVNPMLNTLFEVNPAIKEKVEHVIINTLNRYLNDNNPYYLIQNYNKSTHQFFDNLYIQGVIDYNKEMSLKDEEGNDIMAYKMKDYAAMSDFQEVTSFRNILDIKEDKMATLEKLKLEQMMPPENTRHEKRVKI
jgi:hypothetical protein